MNPAIKNIFTDKIIVPAGKYKTLKEAVEKNKTILSGADLEGADLRGANFKGVIR